jgi:hypothetical protein
MFKELRESMRLMSGPIRGNGRWEKDQRIIFKFTTWLQKQISKGRGKNK